MPGISYIYKQSEDFPSLNEFNYDNINAEKNGNKHLNIHQKVLLYNPPVHTKEGKE
jgi:hypothetical protein